MRSVKNEDAVSPVIGVILMVAITVILAAVIAAFVFNIGGTQTKTPTASITAMNNPDTTGPDLKILHKGGDALKAGDWKLSVVPIGNSPAYINSASDANGTSDLIVGGMINVSSQTTGGTPIFATNNTVVSGGTAFSVSQKYDVKLVYIPANAMLIDTQVEVR